MSKVNVSDFFLEWFKQTNTHLFEKKITRKKLNKEIEEYINDVLEEHMEAMSSYDLPDVNDDEK